MIFFEKTGRRKATSEGMILPFIGKVIHSF
jgi:hypothetical protein